MKIVGWTAFTAAVLTMACPVYAEQAPGVTSAEIRIGGVFPFSGPASSLGLVGRGLQAYVEAINARGGIGGRKIDYRAMDDAYSPPKTVEQVRKLVENDEVAFIFGQLGTAGNTAVAKYLIGKKVPSIAVVTGSAKFTDVKQFPYTTTGIVSYDVEGRIYARHLTATLPDAKYAVLYQNDDLGKDYVNAFKSALKSKYDERVVTAPYEVADANVDSQIIKLRASGAQAILLATTPKFAAQAIRKIAELGWKPTIILNYPSGSINSTLKPAGLENSIGVLAASFSKDPTDPRWDDDEDIKSYRTFAATYLPGSNIAETSLLTGYEQGQILEQILKQCGDDLSRDNILLQAKRLKNFRVGGALPGIVVNTSELDNMVWNQLQMQRWDGKNWEQIGDVLEAGD
jgi:branched-chain amino acid transport system substrate-binding protein